MKTTALALALALAAPAAAHADYWHVAMDSQTHAISQCFPVDQPYPTRTDDGKPAIKVDEFDGYGTDKVVVYRTYSVDFGKNIAHVYSQTEATCHAIEAGRFPLMPDDLKSNP